MSYPTISHCVRGFLRGMPVILVTGLLVSTVLSAPGLAVASDTKQADSQPRTWVGKNNAPAGIVLQRASPKQAWRALKHDTMVTSGDELMALPGARGDLDLQEGVRLSLWGNLPKLSAFPGRESVVVVHASRGASAYFTLVRGRVIVANVRKKGAARVHVHFQRQTYELNLEDPGASVALELVGHWPRGIHFVKKVPGKKGAEPEEVPIQSLVVYVLKGQADLKTGSGQYLLRMPPGQNFFHWDSVHGPDPGPRRITRLPPWADPDGAQTQKATAVRAALTGLCSKLSAQNVAAVLSAAMQGKDAAERELAVYGLGAIDDLPRLVDSLADDRHADVRRAAIDALEHWISCGAGRDQKLYDLLVKACKYSAGQAEIVLQLLYGFSLEDRAHVETYEVLIAYLQSSKLPIRALAQWQLYHWVPAAKDIPYDPAGSAEERARAVKAWKKLLADGKLPPKPPR